jgi:VWFA-related protein
MAGTRVRCGNRPELGNFRLTKANEANKDCLGRHFEVLRNEGQMGAFRKDLEFHAAAAFFALACTISLLSTAPLMGQKVSPDEVALRSWTYRPPAARIRVQAYEVPVGVVVRDGKGQIVSGLKADNFTIYEDGRKQAVSGFSVETRQMSLPSSGTVAEPTAEQTNLQTQAPLRPRYVALYFDDLHTLSGDTRHVQLAAENFIRKGLGANDQIALFTASSTTTIDFTSDVSKLLDALAKLKSHARVFDSGTCPRITPYDAYLIVNHLDPDAYNTAWAAAKQCNCDDQGNYGADCYRSQEQIVMAQAQGTWEPLKELSENTLETIRGVVNYLASKPGERVLVLASPGFLTGTLERQVDEVVHDALRAEVVINALDAKGLYTEDPSHGRMQNELKAGGSADAKRAKREAENFGPTLLNTTAAIADFADATGGRFFHDRNDLAAGYYSLAAAPKTEYLLSFVPEKAKLNGKFHKLKVEVSVPGSVDVQARPGYFAPAKEPNPETTKLSREPTVEEQIDVEVRGSDERSDFPMSVSEGPGAAGNSARQFSVQTRVDIHELPFDRQGDRYVDVLTLVAALFDAQGNMIAGKEAQMQLALKPETFERFSKTGLGGTMTLEAPPGAYRLRVVVEEATRGKMSATGRSVQIQ